jgi:hypothetical protein
MRFFQYLDNLPAVPDDLVANVLNTLDSMPIDHAVPSRAVFIDDKQVENITYNRHRAIDELTEWIHQNISSQYISFGVQVQTPKPHTNTHFPHTDTLPRIWALNYNLDPGGDNAITSWYQERGHPMLRPGPYRPQNIAQLDVLKSVHIQPHKWHLFNTQVLHAVENIHRPRIAITLGFEKHPMEENVFVDR